MPRKEIANQKFGLLLVIRFSHSEKINGQWRTFWECSCACGGTITLRTDVLRSGMKDHCGCQNKIDRHGMYKSSTYRCWASMWARTDPLAVRREYVDQGITVCDRWRSFSAFYADMGERPSILHSLDRYPDQNGNYEPGNVRWATRSEQQNNRRDNKLIEASGRVDTVANFAREYGMNYNTLKSRAKRGGDLLRPLDHEFYAKHKKDLAAHGEPAEG